jgi:hypothetical protein
MIIAPKNNTGSELATLTRLVDRSFTLACCALCVALAVSVAGCESGPELGEVTGTVTLDDQPLAGAVVIFQPTIGGPPSHAETDANGRYELLFAKGKPGATVGNHTVTVETKRFHIPDSVEKVPAKYNSQSQLTRDVAAGEQTINLDLQSD